MPMFPISLGFRELEASRDLIMREKYVLGFLLALASIVANVVATALVLNFAATVLVGRWSLSGADRLIDHGIAIEARAETVRRVLD